MDSHDHKLITILIPARDWLINQQLSTFMRPFHVLESSYLRSFETLSQSFLV